MSGDNRPYKWRVYVCANCGYPVTGGANGGNGASDEINWVFPTPETLQDGLPVKAAAFIRQAMESLHAPSGAIMLCASAVDAMLKEKGLKAGTLYKRIELAAANGLVTSDMSAWAHEIRLDANDERHADENADLPTTEDAKKCIEFVRAIGDFMFILPARVQRGRQSVTAKTS